MPRYMFRKLHLTTRQDMRAEINDAPLPQREEFFTQLQSSAYPIKLLCQQGEFPADWRASLAQHHITFWAATATKGYLFSDLEHLHQFVSDRPFISSEEKIFTTELKEFLERQHRERFVIETKPQPLRLGGRTLLMGVLNCTPDSFYDGGRYASTEAAIAHGMRLAEEGADLIDVGGESTRPKGVYGEGAQPVSAKEEIQRVLPVIEALSKRVAVPISIDTYKAQVAEAAVNAGAGLVNDISGFQFDARMAETVARLGVPVILMHTKGTPANMQENPQYENLMDELYLYFIHQIERAKNAGIAEDRIIVDPGLGFGKRLHDNYEILRRLPEYRGLGRPLLVGPSRKSFVGKALDLPPDQRLEGTAAAVALAVFHGAHIVRVHDVKAMRRTTVVADLIAGRSEL